RHVVQGVRDNDLAASIRVSRIVGAIVIVGVGQATRRVKREVGVRPVRVGYRPQGVGRHGVAAQVISVTRSFCSEIDNRGEILVGRIVIVSCDSAGGVGDG